jgi:hypothetical protein
MWLGFWSVDVPPSPNVHDHELIVAVPGVDWSVKLTVSGANPVVGEPVNSAVGAAGGVDTWTYEVLVAVSLPTVVETVRATV